VLPIFIGRRAGAKRLLLCLGWCLLVATVGATAHTIQAIGREERASIRRPQEVSEDGYVSSKKCRACHPDQYASWAYSFHRRMTQPMTDETVTAPFRGESIRFGPDLVRMDRSAGGFWASYLAGDSVVRRVPLVMATGSHHKQYYWRPVDESRTLALFPYVWEIRQARWIPNSASLLMPPIEDTSYDLGEWNVNCIRCHATQGRPAQVVGKHLFETRVAELGIACESCHGPAEAHVDANHDPLRRLARRSDDRQSQEARSPKERRRLRAVPRDHRAGEEHGDRLAPLLGEGLRVSAGR
jgi:hypothetical protein